MLSLELAVTNQVRNFGVFTQFSTVQHVVTTQKSITRKDIVGKTNHSYATAHNWALLVFCRSKKEWEVTEYAQAMKPPQMPRFLGGVILVIDDSCSLSNFFLLQMIISRYSVSISKVFIESMIRIL